MKNIKNLNIIITICLLIGGQNAHAQWALTGNTIGTNTNWLGTIDAKPLDIRTNSLNRLYITPSGNIGINTSTPLGLLHIDGKVLPGVRNFLVRGPLTGVYAFTNSEVSALSHLGTTAIGGNGWTALYVKKGNNVQTTAGYFDGKVVVQGLVGIGTNAPEDQLQVGTQITKIVMGSAFGPNTGYGAGYIGFNASRQNATSWSTSTDGAHNGAGIIYTNVSGDILFSNIPDNGNGATAGQSLVPDATIANNTRLFIGNNGNIGVGTSSPIQKFDVKGNIVLNENNLMIKGGGDYFQGLGWYKRSVLGATPLGEKPFTNDGSDLRIDGPILFGYNGGALGSTSLGNHVALRWDQNGNIGIDTDLGSNSYNGTLNYYKLSVHGPIRATAVVVETGWADFVFDKNYPLMSLKEVEKYINEKGHLPNIPSTQEIEKKGGADVGELLKLQMQKIEELTLYIIEQNKRIEGLETKLNNLKK